MVFAHTNHVNHVNYHADDGSPCKYNTSVHQQQVDKKNITTTAIILNSVKHFHNIINWHNK